MKNCISALMLSILTLAAPVMATPSGEALIDLAMAAAGGETAFSKLGVLQFEISEQENLLDGTIKKNNSKAFVDATNITNIRLELGSDIILARNGNDAWANIKGELDERVQTPKRVLGTTNQKLVPILMPFSLKGDRITYSNIIESSFGGEKTWKMTVNFPANFFTSPSMNSPWRLHFSQANRRLLAAEVFPPIEYAKVLNEGMRYTVLRYKKINGVDLPAEILLDGIGANGIENGHTRIIRLETSIRGPFEPALFMHPDKLEALEEGYTQGMR